ncbi:MAG TPA: DUF559 domain-containing protein [Mycoplana sp.]|nr:DUF559 domain-containing protein [Mycoplana sp.]
MIELDGSQHASDRAVRHDTARTAFLNGEGYEVLRFWNSDVFEDVDGVLDTIFAVVQKRQILLAGTSKIHSTPAHRADPLPEGEGEES